MLLRASPGDAGELSMFAARSFSDTYHALMDDADLEAYLAEAFRPNIQAAEIADTAATVILARDDTSHGRPIVGYAHLVAHDSDVLLKRLYVATPHKGRGLASSLMEETWDECRRLGCERLRLTVRTRNPRAIAFYRKTGFAVTGSATFMVGGDAQIDHVMEMAVPSASAFYRIAN